MSLSRILLFLAGVLAFPTMSSAAYKCESPDGSLTFTDRPCPENQKSEDLILESEKETKAPKRERRKTCSSYDVADKISIGMTSTEVYEACGYPDDSNRTQNAYGVQEQWVYGSFPRSTSYVYIEDGVVTAIQD